MKVSPSRRNWHPPPPLQRGPGRTGAQCPQILTEATATGRVGAADHCLESTTWTRVAHLERAPAGLARGVNPESGGHTVCVCLAQGGAPRPGDLTAKGQKGWLSGPSPAVGAASAFARVARTCRLTARTRAPCTLTRRRPSAGTAGLATRGLRRVLGPREGGAGRFPRGEGGLALPGMTRMLARH